MCLFIYSHLVLKDLHSLQKYNLIGEDQEEGVEYGGKTQPPKQTGSGSSSSPALHLLILLWGHLASLSLSFLTWEMQIIMPTQGDAKGMK